MTGSTEKEHLIKPGGGSGQFSGGELSWDREEEQSCGQAAGWSFFHLSIQRLVYTARRHWVPALFLVLSKVLVEWSNQDRHCLCLHGADSLAVEIDYKEAKCFPGDPEVKNPPCNAGDTGSIPGPGRSHMPWGNSACVAQLLSLPAATEARMPRACVPQQEKPLEWLACALQLETSPCFSQLERARAATKTESSQK